MSVFTNPSSSTPDQTAQYVAGLLGLLGERDPVAVLRQTPADLAAFVDALPTAAIPVPEAAGKWSVRDVLQHLADSELVAGWRLRLILAQDRPVLTGYDQDLWAERLGYREADVLDALEQFTVLRRGNVRLWERLGPAELMRVGLHSERGEESLGHLRRLYAGHDLMHFAQLHRIRAAVASTG